MKSVDVGVDLVLVLVVVLVLAWGREQLMFLDILQKFL